MNKALKILAISTLSIAGQHAQAISIEFDYSYDTANNFFDTQAKKDVLNTAGNFFANRITDSLGAINSSGDNQFNASFANPGNGSFTTINNFSVAADTLRIYAGGRSLAGSTVGIGGPGGFGVSGSTSFVNAAVSRGQGNGSTSVTLNPRDNLGNVIDKTATDFAPWGGAISFDTDANWYFDDNVSTVESFSGNDFYSVALHELAHLLGFGTSDSWKNKVSFGNFSGDSSGTVALEPDDSHWEDGTLSLLASLSQETAMDPTILRGTRKYMTDLDIAALSDVGWEISAVPVPAAVYFFGSALLGLGAFRKKVK